MKHKQRSSLIIYCLKRKQVSRSRAMTFLGKLRVTTTISPQPRAHLKHVFTSTATSYCIFDSFPECCIVISDRRSLLCRYSVGSSLMRWLLGQHVMCITGSPCPSLVSGTARQVGNASRRYLCRVLLVRPHHRSHSRRDALGRCTPFTRLNALQTESI